MAAPTPTVPQAPTAQQQLIVDMGTRCRRLMQILGELTELHTRVDPPERQSTSETETVLRLRKAYHHIRAVTGWPVDTLILHAMGPDIRTAQAHLRPIVAEFLDDSDDSGSAASVRRNRESNRELLEAICHPTPQVLTKPKHLGGLAPGGHVMSLATLFVVLAELSCNYNTALGTLTQEPDGDEATALLGLMQQAQVELDSAPIEQIFEALGDGESGNA